LPYFTSRGTGSFGKKRANLPYRKGCISSCSETGYQLYISESGSGAPAGGL
jgi:hypothetical protein